MCKRWCGTLWPTAAGAQQAGMGDDAFAGFVRGALFLDRGDPAAAWRELGAFQAGLVERLSDARELRIEADGTDLTLRVAGRAWVNSDGKRNMPSGEVFTGPIEDSANGVVRFTVPLSPRGWPSRRRADVQRRRSRRRAGRARTGVPGAYAGDRRGRATARRDRHRHEPRDRPPDRRDLFDEKIGGTVHLALGRSYPETGGVNESAVHWDLICDLRDGGRLSADGEVVKSTGCSRPIESWNSTALFFQ